MKTSKDLQEQAAEIIRIAEESGVRGNYFFVTTFDRYLTQLSVLDKLKKVIEEDGVLCTKEYVKGRENVYTSPAVSDYNRTTDSANKTVTTLMRIIRDFAVEEKQGDVDPLMQIINGGGDDE